MLIETNVYHDRARGKPAPAKPVVTIGPSKVGIDDVLAIANGSARIALDDSAAFRQTLNRSVELLDRLMEKGEVIYGVNTGFGASCETSVPADLTGELATNLVRFHGCGTGRMLDESETIAVMVVRLASLCRADPAFGPCCWSGCAI